MAREETTGEFTAGELKIASFWVRNSIFLWRLMHGVFIAACIATWGYVIFGLLDAYVISYPRESLLTRQVALNQQQLVSLGSAQPKDIVSTDVTVFQTTNRRYDMMAELNNPNEKWWVEFQYHFNISGEETARRTGYVLPTSKQIVTELGFSPKTQGGTLATLIIDTVRWHRVDPVAIGAEYKAFADSHLNMSFEDVTYDTDIVIGTTHVGQTSFVVHNQSSFGYWNLQLVIRLYRGNSIVAVNAISVNEISPGEKRPLKVVWFETIPGVTKTEIISQVNLLDPLAFLPAKYFK